MNSIFFINIFMWIASKEVTALIWIIQSNCFKIYFMKPECSAIKEKMFYILTVISLFTAK